MMYTSIIAAIQMIIHHCMVEEISFVQFCTLICGGIRSYTMDMQIEIFVLEKC